MTTCASVPTNGAPGSLRIAGTVTRDGNPARCYVRLLDRNAEFVAELPTDRTGGFAFHTIPGDWTVRIISSAGSVDHAVMLVDEDATHLAFTI